MMIEKCITTEEWAAFISATGKDLSEDFLELVKRIHAHIGRCAECRALYEAFVAADNALDEYLDSSDRGFRDSAYQAVAADDFGEKSAICGELSISIRMEAGAGRFCLETLSASGACMRYKFDAKKYGSTLVHAGNNSTWMSIEDGRLRLSFPEYGGMQVVADLISDDGEIRSIDCSGDGLGEIGIEDAGSYFLQLMLVREREAEKEYFR